MSPRRDYEPSARRTLRAYRLLAQCRRHAQCGCGGACKVRPMGELLVHPADLLHAAKQVRTWHDDCAAVFADSLRVIGMATEQGWTASSKESMTNLSTRWQNKHRALLSQVLMHSQGFSSAAAEYTTTDDASSEAIAQAAAKTPSLNL